MQDAEEKVGRVAGVDDARLDLAVVRIDAKQQRIVAVPERKGHQIPLVIFQHEPIAFFEVKLEQAKPVPVNLVMLQVVHEQMRVSPALGMKL